MILKWHFFFSIVATIALLLQQDIWCRVCICNLKQIDKKQRCARTNKSTPLTQIYALIPWWRENMHKSLFISRIPTSLWWADVQIFRTRYL